MAHLTVVKYLDAITYRLDDPTYSILKAHLLFEELLISYVHSKVLNPAALKGARLTFRQTMSVARALLNSERSTHWVWTGIEQLNKLRNSLAHDVNPADLEKRTEDLVRYVQRHGSPLPEPTIRANPSETYRTGQADVSGGPLFTSLDMVTIALFVTVSALLDFDLEKFFAANSAE